MRELPAPAAYYPFSEPLGIRPWTYLSILGPAGCG